MDVVIIGGGAAGFFCAANLKHPNLSIKIIEKSSKILSKVKISGGGRCNVTNGKYKTPAEFANQYPRGKNLLKKTLHHFFYTDTIQWFEKRGVPLHEEIDGRIFPISNDSQSIIDCLIHQCRNNEVEIITNCAAQSIENTENGYLIHTSTGIIHADKVVISTGGYPKLDQYHWMENLGFSITEPVPSLFTFNLPKHPITQLMGVAVPNAQIKVQGEKLTSEGPLLITHWGLSGPCVLKASAWGAQLLANKGWSFGILINWLNNETYESLREKFSQIRAAQGNKVISNKNPFGLPARLWEYLILEADIPNDQSWATLSSKAQNKIISFLTQYELKVHGKTTFKEEFVTAGGIDISNINAQTMQSKLNENIYIIGEALNVDGITGGFNFQNAWTSGFIAAKNILSHIPF